MQIRFRGCGARWALATVLALAALGAVGTAELEGQDVRPTLPPLGIESLGPKESFAFYCAPCHGARGTGDGAVAPALKVRPADLTTLAERNRGEFPRERVRSFIAGTERAVPAHGTGEMPVWGPAFRALDASDTRARIRIDGLVSHIESLQAAEDGGRLYRQHCASCHGSSGLGNGPLALQLRSAPPDLTKFAMRNGGVFPSERVRRIIDGRDVASHGDRDMPVWGVTFKRESPDGSEATATARINALVRFLQAMQERPAE